MSKGFVEATNGRYSVYGPQRLTEDSGGLDVTIGHPRAIVDALKKLTNQINIQRFNGSPAQTITLEELRRETKP